MKVLLYIVALSSVLIIGCSPADSPVINKKIRTLTIINFGDTASYEFIYTGDQLTTVNKNGATYARLFYGIGQVNVEMIKPSYRDTFSIYFSSANYIDSVKEQGMLQRKFFRNASEQLDSCRYTESGVSLFYNNVTYAGNQIAVFRQSRPYTCGIYNTCIKIGLDTATYTTLEPQSNLPEQFFTFPLSEGLSFMDVNPMFLVQQSGIFPYIPHPNLVRNWNTFYSILITQTTPPNFHFRYDYTFDTQQRVTVMYVYNTLQSNTVPFKTYRMGYFD
ncbi:MAG: hypothetical protein U0T77_09100 [Chitinophagales bacterium]